MRPRKLTDEQVEWIREIGRKRALLPTNRQLAREFGCSERLIEDVAAGRRYKVPRGTFVRGAFITASEAAAASEGVDYHAVFKLLSAR